MPTRRPAPGTRRPAPGARIALRRVLAHLVAAGPGLSPLEYARIVGIVFHGARTVARLLRDNQALSGQPGSALAAMIDITMIELSQDLNADLGPRAGPRALPPDHRPSCRTIGPPANQRTRQPQSHPPPTSPDPDD